MRCVPHDEDTGGFFVATFRKREPLPSILKPLIGDGEGDVNVSADLPSDEEISDPQSVDDTNDQSPKLMVPVKIPSDVKVEVSNNSGSKGLSEYINIDEEVFDMVRVCQ